MSLEKGIAELHGEGSIFFLVGTCQAEFHAFELRVDRDDSEAGGLILVNDRVEH